MALEYINYVRAKTRLSSAKKSEEPLLSEEDEKFLDHLTAEAPLPPLPVRPPKFEDLPEAGETRDNDAQIALMEGAQNTPLPETPDELTEEPMPTTETAKGKKSKMKLTWNWLTRDSRYSKRKAASDLQSVAEGLKTAEGKPEDGESVADAQAKREEEDMVIVLERLNLAAVNNRVFSISEETQELLQKFNQIFKDLIQGAPTAYDDLESLLTNGDKQLQKTFNHLPSFLQKLIEQLPSKMTHGFAPEIMAAAAERAGKSGINTENMGKAATAAKNMGLKTPSLKDLVGHPGTIAGVLRSVIAFLRARFPAFMGMNVLWSLALFGELLEASSPSNLSDMLFSCASYILVLP